jgi:hypothetical protein
MAAKMRKRGGVGSWERGDGERPGEVCCALHRLKAYN